jgi:putative transposase
VSPAKKRRAAAEVQEELQVSERRVCRVLGQARSTQRREHVIRTDEEALRQRVVALACAYGRYGYRRITALLRNDGWHVNHKRVARISPPGGAKGTATAAKTEEAVAERWVLYPVATRTP